MAERIDDVLQANEIIIIRMNAVVQAMAVYIRMMSNVFQRGVTSIF